jgi:hypothetical protein
MNSALLAPRAASPDAAKAAKAALLRGTPTVNPDQAEVILPGLLRDAGVLLGLSESQAGEFSRSGALAMGTALVVVTPVVSLDDNLCDLLVCVDTGLRLADTDALTSVRWLQHASGLLVAHQSAIASSPDGSWMLCRRIALGDLKASGLRDAVVASIELLAYVFDAQDSDSADTAPSGASAGALQ